jgi:hypothetical protein
MVKHGDTMLPRYGLSIRPLWGVAGDTDTDARRLVASMAAKGKHAPAIIATMAAEYDARAKGWKYNERKKRGE